MQARLVQMVLLVRWVVQVVLDQLELLERQVLPDPMDNLDLMVYEDKMAKLANEAMRGQME